jgi:hypothetical protein
VTTRAVRLPVLSAVQVSPLVVVALGGLATAGAFGGALVAPSFNAPVAFAVALGVGVLLWLVANRRLELGLAVLLIWLGVFDGFVRLKTGADELTAIRDAFLYAIVIGWLIRSSVEQEDLHLPPLSGWVIAFVALVLVQLFNPGNESIVHAIAGLRPHLAWIPLFFLGYAVMRSENRLRALAWLLVAVTAINGAVSLVQATLSLDQLSAWGPGYQERLAGTGEVAARFFETPSGEFKPRPFGLGSDSGFGGQLGVIALPFALALVASSEGRRRFLLLLPLVAGTPLAIVASQQRTAIVAAAVTTIAFAALVATSRSVISVVVPLIVAFAVGVPVISATVSAIGSGGFNSYQALAPSNLFGSTQAARGKSLGLIPEYLADMPFGGGLASVGPAASLVDTPQLQGLDGETEFTFLIVEVGIPGLLVVLGLHFTLLMAAATRIRRTASESRLLLAAVAAPLYGIFAAHFTQSTSATSPFAPYFWFAAGILAYHLFGERYAGAAPDRHRGGYRQRGGS